MLDTYLRKLANKSEMLNLFIASKDMACFKLFNNEKDLSRLQSIFLSYLYFYHSLNNDVASERVSEKVFENEIYENAWAYYRSKVKEDKKPNNPNNQREFQGIFSKTNEINFPKEDK